MQFSSALPLRPVDTISNACDAPQVSRRSLRLFVGSREQPSTERALSRANGEQDGGARRLAETAVAVEAAAQPKGCCMSSLYPLQSRSIC